MDITITPGNDLTEREIKFLDALFGEAEGDPKVAKMIAGYPKNKPTHQIVAHLKEHIIDATQQELALMAPHAVHALYKILTQETPNLGDKEKIQTALAILDRAGLVKVQRKEVAHTHTGGVALLPPKKE